MPASTSTLKDIIQEDMKNALRAGEKNKLSAIRLILAAIKQREIDERISLSNDQVLVVLDKMIKQRRESIAQYKAAERNDLVDKENLEIQIIQHYLPPQLSHDEINQLIDEAIQKSEATSTRDMGKVMAILKPNIQGRADVGTVSQKVKDRLSTMT